MNWLLIVILAVIAGNVIWGYKEGFMKVALSLISWVMVLVACYIATPIVSDYILQNTPLEEVVQETLTDALNAALDEVSGGVVEALDSEKIAEVEASLPSAIKQLIYGGDEPKTLEDLINSVGDVELDTSGLAVGAANLIGLMIVLVVTRIALIIVEKVLDLVAKLPLIGQANTLLGIAAGALKGLVWTWVVLTIIGMLAYTGVNTELMMLVEESEILTWLANNNPIIMVVVKYL
jgi:uncharacterized membrane protein required for colicin V production